MVITDERFLKNNPIADTDMVIIVTSYNGHLPFLGYALSRYKETKKYVICSYDRHNDVVPNDIMNIPDAWVFKHETFGAEKRNGWLWDIVYAAGIVESFQNVKYVATVNGDCIWDKPQNVDQLIDMLGVYDILSASCDPNLIHTCNMIWSRACFITFVEEIKDALKQNIAQSHSPEVLLRDFMKQYDTFHNVPVLKQPIYPKGHFYEGKIDHYSAYNQDSTFKEVVGYRNLGGEHKAACLEHLEPVEAKYFDLRDDGKFLNQHEKTTLYHYLKTNDRRYLYKYWTEGEDSYWNRRYYSIDYFGNVPLWDDSKRKELGPPSERLGHFDRWKYNSFVLKDEEYENKWKEVIEKSGG